MAFIGGTRVRPELGMPDLRGFSQAAEIEAESMARIGASITGAVKNYQEKQRKKEAEKMFDQMIKGFADSDSNVGRSLRSVGLNDEKTISASRVGLGEEEMLRFINAITEQTVQSEFNNAKLEAERKRMNQPETMSVKTLGAFKESLPSDVILTPEGTLVDTTFRNEVLPRDHPLVQQMMQTEEGRFYLRGYGTPEFIGQTADNSLQDNNPIDIGVITRK